MFRPRIIPVLLLKNNGLVKSVQFKKHKYIGDPLNAIKILNDLRADEIILLDIDASKKGKIINVDLVKQIGEETKMPMTVGGGIRTLNDIKNLITAGAEKVIIGSYALERPDFVKEATDAFGSSTISVCIDVKKTFFGNEYAYNQSKKKTTSIPVVKIVKVFEQMNVGEIVIQSVDNDGRMNGYDIELIKKISTIVQIPIVALGGAGSLNDLKTTYQKTCVSALAAGSIFVFNDESRGVLINYPNKNDKKVLFL
jgi:cyclase